MDTMGRYVVELYRQHHPKPLCFENLSNQHDIPPIRAAGGLIVAIVCPFDIRFSRARNMEDGEDSLDTATFRAAEEAEYDSPDPFGSHVSVVMQQADIELDGSQEPREVLDACVRAVGSLIAQRATS